MFDAAEHLAAHIHEVPAGLFPACKATRPPRIAGSAIYPAVQNGPSEGVGCLTGPSALLKRCSSRLTVAGCHLPPHADGICRAFNSRAMALNETCPFAWSSRIVEARALACASAACLFASPLLILPLVIKSKPSIRPREVRCQLPPPPVGIPLRFNSSASARWETKPAAISFRMVGARAAARSSAARLFFKAARIARLRDDVFPLYLRHAPSWPDLTCSARQRRVTILGCDVQRRTREVNRAIIESMPTGTTFDAPTAKGRSRAIKIRDEIDVAARYFVYKLYDANGGQ